MLSSFLAGAVTFGLFAAGLFFLRFWQRTTDRLFLSFALAFALLGLNQLLLEVSNFPIEERSWLYLLRLAAFCIIIGSVVHKNREVR